MANISRFFWAAATAISSNNTPLGSVRPELKFTARLASVKSARALLSRPRARACLSATRAVVILRLTKLWIANRPMHDDRSQEQFK